MRKNHVRHERHERHEMREHAVKPLKVKPCKIGKVTQGKPVKNILKEAKLNYKK